MAEVTQDVDKRDDPRLLTARQARTSARRRADARRLERFVAVGDQSYAKLFSALDLRARPSSSLPFTVEPRT